MSETTESADARRQALKDTREQKLSELFQDRSFVIKEKIELPTGQSFTTPLGNKGRHGFVLVDTKDPTNIIHVGKALLKEAQARGAVVEQ